MSTRQDSHLLSVAPMMAWTDRHCRYLLRLCTPNARLFTEMVTTGALLHGPRARLLAFNTEEHPVVLQVGGSDLEGLAAAARFGEEAGFDEINLNVGCPSPRVQRGRFGACLMKEPEFLATAISVMQARVSIPISVKCRLGVDDQDSQPLLESMVAIVAQGGCRRFYVHARKALLNGLSPAQNREIPPLQPDRVYALKARYPDLQIVINGGITDTLTAVQHLQHVDGVMIGREAYHHPLFMGELDSALFGTWAPNAWQVMTHYLNYMTAELAAGTRLQDMTRHCLGLFPGVAGARRFRQILSDNRRLQSNSISVVHDALAELTPQVA